MKFSIDLYIHSHYSLAGSDDPFLVFFVLRVQKKGIPLIGIGDFSSQ